MCLLSPRTCKQARPKSRLVALCVSGKEASIELWSVADADLVVATGNLTLPVGPALTGVAAETFAASAPSPAGAAAAAPPAVATPGQSFTDCYSPTLYHLPDRTCAPQPCTRIIDQTLPMPLTDFPLKASVSGKAQLCDETLHSCCGEESLTCQTYSTDSPQEWLLHGLLTLCSREI